MDELPCLRRQDTEELFIKYFAALSPWQLPRLYQAAAFFALRSILIAA